MYVDANCCLTSSYEAIIGDSTMPPQTNIYKNERNKAGQHSTPVKFCPCLTVRVSVVRGMGRNVCWPHSTGQPRRLVHAWYG